MDYTNLHDLACLHFVLIRFVVKTRCIYDVHLNKIIKTNLLRRLAKLLREAVRQIYIADHFQNISRSFYKLRCSFSPYLPFHYFYHLLLYDLFALAVGHLHKGRHYDGKSGESEG